MSTKSTFSLKFEPILHSKYYGSIPLVSVYVADIEPPLKISEIVKVLNKMAFDDNLRHLKRVFNEDGRKYPRVIIGITDAISSQQLDDYRQLGLNNFEVVKVPSTQPWTRRQFNECRIVWPVNFHEEKFTRKCLDGTRFNATDFKNINSMMEMIIDLSTNKGKDVAMVVGGDTVLGTGVCDSVNHPLKHCCVNVVDLIAIEQVKNYPLDGHQPERPYLCTDFDVFVTREPCLMCSMALLHSRIKRIFFSQSNSNIEYGCTDDGSFTRMRLHVNPQLNHRIEVWKVIKSESS